ncbi:hypothetical protein [Frankia sp. Cr2]|uniref:hypothetical protein n=1 Tax=Frankia sp. Cr2 TaxID=3073932 RepID=UPI002AD245AA|nr:hypothetical protein [Frankia sp. Cr2]
MTPFPVDRYLVPEQPIALPAGFAPVRQRLTAGLPQRIELGAGVHAVLVLPTGLAQQWLDTEPLAVVSTSADDLAARPVPGVPSLPRLVARTPLRLVVRRGTQILGSVPLAVGLRRVCAAGAAPPGPSGGAAAVELMILDWHLAAGTVRGSGDYGSHVSLGWRRADQAVDDFGPPPINVFVSRRRPPAQRIESEQGQAYLRYSYLLDKKLRRVIR